jgi:hypothetical protein
VGSRARRRRDLRGVRRRRQEVGRSRAGPLPQWRGPARERVEVLVEDVAERAAMLAADRPGTTSSSPLPDDMLPVPRDEWARIVAAVGHLHEAGNALAEARERAGRAETTVEFLRERVRALEAERDGWRTKAEELPEGPQPSRRRWWQF